MPTDDLEIETRDEGYLSNEDLSRFMNYDHFDDAPEVEAEAEVEAPDDTEAEVEPDAEAPAPEAAPAPAAPSAEDRLTAALENIAKLADRREAPAETVRPAPENDGKDEQHELERLAGMYNFAISDNVVAGLSAEDPAQVKSTLQGILREFGVALHRNILGESTQRLAELRDKQLPRMLRDIGQMTNSQQAVAFDMYSNYPGLGASETLRRVTMETAFGLAREKKVNSWSSEFRDAVAQKVATNLGIDVAALRAKPGSKAPVKETAPAAPPNKMLKTKAGSRSAPTPTTPDDNSPDAVAAFVASRRH